MALADYGFFIVAILGVIGTLNNPEPISDLTITLLTLITLGTFVMGVVLNTNLPIRKHGTVNGEEHKSSSED